jgi:hypothetical protein
MNTNTHTFDSHSRPTPSIGMIHRAIAKCVIYFSKTLRKEITEGGDIWCFNHKINVNVPLFLTKYHALKIYKSVSKVSGLAAWSENCKW